jgi:hypothetical protein
VAKQFTISTANTVSSHEFYGFSALDQLSNPKLPPAYVHSDVYVTMTGFTRFMHENDAYSLSTLGWRYNKTENMPDSEYDVYTHLITDRTNYTGFHIYREPIK